MLDRFIDFGKLGASRIAEHLFWIGTALSAIPAFLFGRFIYMTTTYNKEISYFQNDEQWFTYKPVNNLPLGIGGGIFTFLVSVFIWKIVCEVLYLAVRCMETYLEDHREKVD